MDVMVVPANLSAILNDGDKPIILILRWPLIAVHMGCVPAFIAHQVGRHLDVAL